MYVVTGGAGFIGSVLCKRLNQAGHKDLIVVDRLHDGNKWLNLRNIEFSEYYHADDFLDCLVQGELDERSVEGIFHLGACSSTTETDADFLMKNNFGYSRCLFEFASERGIPFLYASSAATYGALESGFEDDHASILSLAPLNPYGFSKHLFDQWVLRQEKTPPFWAGIKFFNVFGPNEYHKGEMRSVVYKAFHQIVEKGEVNLFESHRPTCQNGEQKRDFIYVIDAVKALQMLMEKGGKNSQTGYTISGLYNLGTGKARSFNDLVKSVFKALNLTPKIKYIPMPVKLQKQYQYFTEAKMKKLMTVLPELKFEPLESSVKNYVVEFLNCDEKNYE
jgi:ADP-L-glycero-D-manno-heptose 6-epimerase